MTTVTSMNPCDGLWAVTRNDTRYVKPVINVNLERGLMQDFGSRLSGVRAGVRQLVWQRNGSCTPWA
jgi:hypothetical protein